MHDLPLPQPARTEELAPAFRLIFQHLPPADADARVANALHLLQRGDLDSAGIFILRDGHNLTGAVVCLPVAGASALVCPPGVIDDEHAPVRENHLLQHACAWLRCRGVKIAQALLSPDEEHRGAPLLRAGFDHVTNLWYMRHDLRLLPPKELAGRLAYEPFDPDKPALFQHTLARTYEHTLDCPEVTGVRTIEEVIRGHQAQGMFDPDHWWLAYAAGRPVGVMILADLNEGDSWEVAYMGIIPEARRHGFGREMLLEVLRQAHTLGVPRVVLSVDARNQPAWDLYRSLGFEPFDRRAVFLVVWHG
jgi:ribosomal protein S18 acetylase RimI-like enzyme